jgi:hypothetical protein
MNGRLPPQAGEIEPRSTGPARAGFEGGGSSHDPLRTKRSAVAAIVEATKPNPARKKAQWLVEEAAPARTMSFRTGSHSGLRREPAPWPAAPTRPTRYEGCGSSVKRASIATYAAFGSRS